MPRQIVARTGNEAMAEAMRQINPDVVAAYPITPATEIVQLFANFVSDGVVDTEFVAVESEHSAMSACIGAAAAGARVMTGTSSQGLALMHEELYIASALRLPIVLCEVNRALSAPINIHCDHSDTMGSRDAGWIQMFSENAQEAYDNIIQAMKIAEEVLFPAMATTDGFVISHGMERIEMLDDKEVQDFIGEHRGPFNVLDIENPITIGPLDLQDYFFEHKRSQIEAMKQVIPVIKKVGKEFGDKFGRYYDTIEIFGPEDAEVAIIALGSTAGTIKHLIKNEWKEKVKLVKIRVFRPFPAEDIVNALKGVKSLAIMDRSDTLSNQGGPVATEVKSALYEIENKPHIVNFVYGLGGRDVDFVQLNEVKDTAFEILNKGKVDEPVKYIGVRE